MLYIVGYVAAQGVKPTDPLFIAMDFHNFGRPLSGDGLYAIVRMTCARAGISKRMSPHRIRHSGITEALDLAKGDYRLCTATSVDMLTRV